jgi:hypothetical protein
MSARYWKHRSECNGVLGVSMSKRNTYDKPKWTLAESQIHPIRLGNRMHVGHGPEESAWWQVRQVIDGA